MSKFMVVYCYEVTKMDGIQTRIELEGIFDTDGDAQEAEQNIWSRFEKASADKRPRYLLTTDTIEIDV